MAEARARRMLPEPTSAAGVFKDMVAFGRGSTGDACRIMQAGDNHEERPATVAGQGYVRDPGSQGMRERTMVKDLLRRFRRGLRNAFSLESPYGPLTDLDRRFLDRLAESIAQRGWTDVAILYLSGHRPLGSLSSQAMVFLRPLREPLQFVLHPLLKRLFDDKLLAGEKDYDRLAEILDRREGVDAFIEAVEAAKARDVAL